MFKDEQERLTILLGSWTSVDLMGNDTYILSSYLEL